MNDRPTDPNPLEADGLEAEQQIRPARFCDMLGQESVKQKLKIAVEAAIHRGEAMDHVILHGPPGLGKTTLAYVLANELGVDVAPTSGPVIERASDLAGLLSNLKERDILFIDEIHRINRIAEEHLYSAMEDFTLDLMIDSGPSARSVQIPLEKFTLIGATTRWGLLTPPMRSRFGIVERLDFYSTEELAQIVTRSAGILNIEVDVEGALEVAMRSRGTPRIAIRLLRRSRDFAQARADGVITGSVAVDALELLNIDRIGLDEMDRRLLSAVIEKFGGGPVGLSNLATAVSEESDTIEEVYEPFLIQEGFLKRTSRGREATIRAYEHLGLKPPQPSPDQMPLL